MEYICKFCGKICKNANSLAQHEKRCKSNPNRIPLAPICIKGCRGHKGTNQYTKAKETGIPYIISNETKQKLSKISKGKTLPDITKLKISESMKKYYEGKTIWYTSNNNRLSYAENYFRTIFTTAEFNYHVGRYFLDFAWPDKLLYIEIDGEQHYTESGIQHDLIRSEYLSSMGWTCIKRIRWKEFNKLDYSEKEKIIQELFDYLNEKKSFDIL